ncbi:hypothetical protein SteCoe_39858 [Stentor coeruleus]|uniref:Uncharacterized protein n=1 Tax=Stentor coeruleus TaxID=5963 RepID=A0A1R2AKJ9_9CILI|nr:hypothetical protein SteCoe_39858 [Stentor coeruleus]
MRGTTYCEKKKEIDEIFKQYDVKHLPVVDRMVIDINKRMLREKALSMPSLSKTSPEKFSQTPQSKALRSPLHNYTKYTYLGEFYTRLEHDIEKRRIKSKIRQQIKKILDKKKEKLPEPRTYSPGKPHLPHKYINEQSEIEKLYGLPGKPMASTGFTFKF